MTVKFIRSIAILGGLAIAAMPASSSVVGFEDIPNPGCCTSMPGAYQGFSWSASWVVAQESANVFSGVEAHSGQNFAWSNGGANLSLSGAVFDLNGFWARIGNLTAGTAIAHGFLGGVEVQTQLLTLTDVYAFQTVDFLGIDRFTLTNQANNVLIDDITVNASAVPEPGTLALAALALALGGVGLRRRG